MNDRSHGGLKPALRFHPWSVSRNESSARYNVGVRSGSPKAMKRPVDASRTERAERREAIRLRRHRHQLSIVLRAAPGTRVGAKRPSWGRVGRSPALPPGGIG